MPITKEELALADSISAQLFVGFIMNELKVTGQTSIATVDHTAKIALNMTTAYMNQRELHKQNLNTLDV